MLGKEHEVDIVRDVCNIAQVHFSAEVFNLPLKTEKSPHGVYSEQELYFVMAIVFTCIFFDLDPAKSFPLRQVARKVAQELGKLLELRVQPAISATEGLLDRFHSKDPLPMYGKHMIAQLLKQGLSTKDIIWSHLMGTAGGAVAIQGQLISVVLDFYLQEENKHHLETLQRLAKMDTKEADDQILLYFMEGARLASSAGVFRDLAKRSTIPDGDKTLELPAGRRIFLNFVKSSRDPERFPHPELVDATRPIDSYIHYGWGPHQCLGTEMSRASLSAMLKVFCKLDNLRRAPGKPGTLKHIKDEASQLTTFLTPDGGSVWPFPSTMCVRWDGDVPTPKMEDVEMKE